METHLHFLNHFFSPNLFTPDAYDQIIKSFRCVQFSKNDFLKRSNQSAHKYWFIESGYVRAFVMNDQGKDVSTEFFGPLEIAIDWVAFFQRIETSESLQALNEVVAWEIDFQSFQTLFHAHSDFRESGRSRLVQSYCTLKKKHLESITLPAKDRYTELLKKHPSLFQIASLKHIASYLGITDTSLSRIRKEIMAEN